MLFQYFTYIPRFEIDSAQNVKKEQRLMLMYSQINNSQPIKVGYLFYTHSAIFPSRPALQPSSHPVPHFTKTQPNTTKTQHKEIF